MESLIPAKPGTRAVHLAATDSVDIHELAAVAGRTFPLACPPSIARQDVASFIDTHLTATHFAQYLADPQRAIFTAQQDGRIVGYAMLVRGVGDDADVARAVELRPAAELSKMYVLPGFHGDGWSSALMDRALATAADWRVRCVWLGVNWENQRAQRFYLKNGFRIAGNRTCLVGGDRRENDYVMVREVC
jgi:ribosomal protein S18 acetylase RimI-like enzyme